MAIFAATLLIMFTLAACEREKHPDVKDAVNTAMTRNDLGVVKVSQDRDKGVLTLSGDVETADQKAQAESIAAQTAPGYTIANEIGVRPVGQESQAKSVDSNLDDGIESNFKASLKAHKDSITSIFPSRQERHTCSNGFREVPAQKAQAQKLAKAVPNVKEVVNEIEVR